MTDLTKEEILGLLKRFGNRFKAAKAVGIKKSSFYDMCDRVIGKNDTKEYQSQDNYYMKSAVKNSDKLRVANQFIRESLRKDNVGEELTQELISLLDKRKDFYTARVNSVSKTNSKKVGVIQLSDLHFGELVVELATNKFDMEIASKRLAKLVDRSVKIFKNDDISSVAVFLTGDLINSTRRLSEITAYAAPRVNVVFNAFLIIGALLEQLAEHFNVSVAQVVGNESRLAEDFDSTDFLASDNFDLMLYNLLKHTHSKSSIKFLDCKNPMENVVEVNGYNFLLLHGNGHKGLAYTNKIESEVEKIKAKYASMGIIIHYVICGHIHSAFLSNFFGRSASLVGSNTHSERTLNYNSKAAQNIYIIDEDGSVDAMMIDLQKYEGYGFFGYDKENICYNSNKENYNIIIQKVLA